MIKTLLATLGFAMIASMASAQQIDSYVLRSYAVGAPAPTSTFTFLATTVTCNLAQPSGVLSNVNPTRVVWNDPSIAGRACVWTDPGTGPLFSLPIGNYEATLTAVNSVGASAEQVARIPFSKQSVPAVVTGLRLYQ